jgi:hypothetical protein
MDIKDIHALLAEHFLSSAEQSIAGMALTALSMAEAGGTARAALQGQFDRTHQSYAAFAEAAPLSVDAKKGLVEFLGRSPSDFKTGRTDSFRFAFENCFVWQRLTSHRALHSLPPLEKSPLDADELLVWRRWLPTQLQGRCEIISKEAARIRELLVDGLSAHSPDPAKINAARGLLLTNYEVRTFGAFIDQLYMVKLYLYLYEYSLATEKAQNGDSGKARQLQLLLSAVTSNFLKAIEIVPWCIFGLRYSLDLMRYSGQRFNMQAPFSTTSINSWQVVGTGSPSTQLSGSRTSVEYVAPRMTAYLNGTN